MIIESFSPEITAELGRKLGAQVKPGDVICLTGDLGVGKTVFTQGFAEGLGIDEPICSPTFTIILEYHSGRIPLYHFDVYRILDPEEMYEIGYEEYVYGDGVSIIEWPGLISDILPEERYDITISKNHELHTDFREILIEKRGK